jgi:hypothetical protein
MTLQTCYNGRKLMDYSLVPIAVAIAAAQFALDYNAGYESAVQRNGELRFRPGRYFRLMSYLVRIPGDVDQRSELMSITIPK